MVELQFTNLLNAYPSIVMPDQFCNEKRSSFFTSKLIYSRGYQQDQPKQRQPRRATKHVTEKSISRLLNLISWLISVSHKHGLRLFDNLNIFSNCADHFQPDKIKPNCTGSRMLEANMLFTEMQHWQQVSPSQSSPLQSYSENTMHTQMLWSHVWNIAHLW